MPLKIFFSSASIKIANIFLTFALTLILAKLLGDKEFGTYTYILTIITLSSFFIQLGLPKIALRETAHGIVNKEWGEIKRVWVWSFKNTIIATMIVSSILITFALLATPQDTEFSIFMVGLILMPIIALAALRGAIIRGLGHVIIGQLPEFIIKPLSFFLLLLLTYSFTESMSPLLAMLLHVVGASLAFLVGTYYFLQLIPSEIRTLKIEKNHDSKYLWSAVIAIAVSTGMTQINSYLDLLIIGYYYPSEQVAYYKVAYQVSILVGVGLQVVAITITPRIASAYQNQDFTQLQLLITIGARISIAIAIPMLLFLIISGEELLIAIFGEQYKNSYIPLLILAFSQVINAFFGPTLQLMNMSKNEKPVAKIMTLSTLFNIVFNIALIPKYGLYGAAISTLASTIFWNVSVMIYSHKKINISCHPF